MKLLTVLSGVIALLLFTAAMPALAYLGPGGVISGLGSLLALIAAVLAAIVGFLWFPIKRMIKRSRGVHSAPGDTQKNGSPEQDH